MNPDSTLRRTALLLTAFGGPHTLDDVPPFLTELLGRRPSDRQVRDLAARYESIGGGSPLPAMTMRQAAALRELLAGEGYPVAVYVGMGHGRPSIAQAVTQMAHDGMARVVMCSLSPYRSPYTSEGYYRETRRLCGHTCIQQVVEIDPWYAHPSLWAAWAEHLGKIDDREEIWSGTTPVVFTAHSLPLSIATSCGYVDQLRVTIEGIMTLVPPLAWHLAFQSRGRGHEPWLTPAPETVLEQLRGRGHENVVVVPLGFVADHLETLYDLDISLRTWAQSRGQTITRVPCFNDHTYFVRALADVVREKLRDL